MTTSNVLTFRGFFILLLLHYFTHMVVNGMITSQHVIGSDRFINTYIGATGLAKGASVKLSYGYSNGSLPSSSAFIILADSQQMNRYYKIPGEDDDNDGFFSLVCLAPSTMRVQLDNDALTPGEYTFTIPYTDQYGLLFIQCSSSYIGELNVDMKAETLNPDEKGHLVHHMGMENVALPMVYTGLLATAITLLIAWVGDLFLNWKHVTALHIGCAFALVMKIMELGVQLTYYHRLDMNGQVSNFIKVSSTLIQKFSTLSQLAVLFLISLGFKVNRSRLSGKEVRLLLITFGLYVSLSSSQAACVGSVSDDQLCQAYELSEYVMQSLILLGIIVSINFNITHLRASLNDYPWSSTSVPLQYRALRQFHFFRWAFLLYLLLPTILLIARIMLLSWPYAWLDQLLRQGAFLAIYVAIAVTFAPTDNALYVKPFEMSVARHHQAGQGRDRQGYGGDQQQQQQDIVIQGGVERGQR